jgi:hypothetical protein
MLVKLLNANDQKHKYVAVFSNGRRVKFGGYGYSDYTIHKDPERKKRYQDRHRKDLDTKDPYAPGYLSWYVLWNKPTLSASIADYNKRFF